MRPSKRKHARKSRARWAMLGSRYISIESTEDPKFSILNYLFCRLVRGSRGATLLNCKGGTISEVIAVVTVCLKILQSYGKTVPLPRPLEGIVEVYPEYRFCFFWVNIYGKAYASATSIILNFNFRSIMCPLNVPHSMLTLDEIFLRKHSAKGGRTPEIDPNRPKYVEHRWSSQV